MSELQKAAISSESVSVQSERMTPQPSLRALRDALGKIDVSSEFQSQFAELEKILSVQTPLNTAFLQVHAQDFSDIADTLKLGNVDDASEKMRAIHEEWKQNLLSQREQKSADTEITSGRDEEALGKKNTEALRHVIEGIDKLYKLFGGREAFKQKFPDYDRWQDEAREKIRQSHPKLKENSEEFKSKVELSVLVNHRVEIESSLPEEKRKEFVQLFSELKKAARSEQIDIRTTISGLSRTRPVTNVDQAKQTFSESELRNLTRRGDELRSSLGGDMSKVLDMRTGRVYTEWPGGIRIESNANYGNPYENLARINMCQSEKATLESGVRAKTEGFGKVAKSILPNRPELASLDMSDPDRFRSAALDLRESLRKHFLSQIMKGGDLSTIEEGVEGWELSNEEDQRVAKGIMESISQEAIEETVKQIERIRELERMIAVFRAADERRIPEYQERVRTQDEIGRANLAYLSSLRLGVLGQENFQRFIDLVNAHRGQLMGGMTPELNLSELFGVEEKRLIARALGRMLGNDDKRIFQDPPQEYELRRFALDADQTTIDDEYVRGKLRAGNPPMMDQMGRLHAVVLEAALQGTIAWQDVHSGKSDGR